MIFFKKIFYIIIIFYSAFNFSDEFSALSSMSQSDWSIFQEIPESDSKLLEKYKRLFFENFRKEQTDAIKIPQVVHFIWIGPKPFPKESVKNVLSWIKFNPDCIFKFWTDRERADLPDKLKINFINQEDFNFFEKEYEESENYGQKSDLLRYEILYREGGIYVDHDVECFQSFFPLVNRFHFFCGLEPPHVPIGDSMITVCNNLIGSIACHPILEKTILRIKHDWEPLKKLYGGDTPDKKIKRVFYSTFLPFSESVSQNVFSENDINIVLPPSYFNSIGSNKGIFAHHEYASTWFENETKFENLVRKRLVKIAKKSNLILLLVTSFFLINLLLIIILFILFQKFRKKSVVYGSKNS